MAKNYIAFVVLSAAFLVGWVYLQQRMFPPVPVKPKEVEVKTEEQLKAEAKAKEDENVKAEEKKPKEEAKLPDEKKPEKKALPGLPLETFELVPEGEKTNIRVWLTNRGAGVSRLVLTGFEKADYLGRPVKEEMALIQDDPFVTSFRMYHFEEPKSGEPTLGLGEQNWKVEQKPAKDDKGIWKAVFSTEVPNSELEIHKTFSLDPKDYHVGMTIKIVNTGAKKGRIRYQIVGAHGLPVEGEWYTSTFRVSAIGMVDAANNLIRVTDESQRISHRSGGDRVPTDGAAGEAGLPQIVYAGVMNQYFASVLVVDKKQPNEKIDYRKILAWARPTQESEEVKGVLVDFQLDGKRPSLLLREGSEMRSYDLLPRLAEHIKELGLKGRSEKKDGDPVVLSYCKVPGTEDRVGTWIRKGQVPRGQMDDLAVRVHSDLLEIDPKQEIQHHFMLYHGPVKTKLLGQLGVEDKLVDMYTDEYQLRTLTDYPSNNALSKFFYSIGWTSLLIACTRFMHFLLHMFHYVTFGNYGLAIILLTLLVRGVMFPVSRKQALLSMKMQDLAPELKKIREKYKDDPLTAHRESNALMKKHNASPMAGCFPVLMQMPIFLGLYYALQESIHFRLAPFLWIKNLAAPDMLFWWTDTIPWISDPDNQGGMLYLGPFFNLLPIFAVGLMVVQQKFLAPPPTSEEQEVQQKTMQFMMLFMGVMFYKVAAGLCIYFIVSSVWGITERKILPKKKTETVVVTPKTPPAYTSKGKGKQPPKPEPDGSIWGQIKKRWNDLLEEARKK